MKHLLSLLLVLALALALAAPVLAASPEVIDNLVEEEVEEETEKKETKKADTKEEASEPAAEAAAPAFAVVADAATKDAAIAAIFNGAESISVNGTDLAAADIVLAGKVTGEGTEGTVVPVQFSAAGVTEPGLSMTMEEFLAKYAVIVMINGVPTPIEQIPGATIEMVDGVIKANLPLGSTFAIIAKEV